MDDEQLCRLAAEAGFDVRDGEIAVMMNDDQGVSCHEEIRKLVDLLQDQNQPPAIKNTRPVDRYIVLYAEAEELLNLLREQHESNYQLEPSAIDWSDVGSLSHFVEVLQYAIHSLPNSAI